MQEEEVHVGEGSELAAAVAAEGDHRALDELALGLAVRPLRRHLADPGHHDVHLVAAAARDLRAAQPEAVAHPQPIGLELQEAPEGLHVIGIAGLRERGRVPAHRAREGRARSAMVARSMKQAPYRGGARASTAGKDWL